MRDRRRPRIPGHRRAEYTARLAARRERIAALDRTHLLISNSRLVLACAGAILLWLAFVSAALSPLWPALAWLAFGALVVLHARLFQRIDRARNAERWYVRGLDRLAGRWAGAGRDGTAFLEGHSYAHDLDLFGRASLFELLNTARTGAGETTLAEWLRAGAPIDEIRARQAGGRGAAADARLPRGRRRARATSRPSAAPGPWRPGRRPRRQAFRARSGWCCRFWPR